MLSLHPLVKKLINLRLKSDSDQAVSFSKFVILDSLLVKFKLMCAQVAASTNKVTNFVGKVVNGFDIQKLIGELVPLFLLS